VDVFGTDSERRTSTVATVTKGYKLSVLSVSGVCQVLFKFRTTIALTGTYRYSTVSESQLDHVFP
jgi:hypothetical protein